MANNGWIGVDLDGTLAHYEGWKGADKIGEPIPAMVDRVKQWLDNGTDVRIFTARVYWDGAEETKKVYLEALRHVQEWSLKVFGAVLPVTNIKDFGMVTLYDDRAVQIMPNAGTTREEHMLNWFIPRLKAHGLEIRQGQFDLEIVPIQVPKVIDAEIETKDAPSADPVPEVL